MEEFKEEKNNSLINPLINANIKLKYTKILLVFIGFLLVLFSGMLPSAAKAASLYFSPSSGSYEVEKTFSVNIYVSSADYAMNAVSGAISFPADKLEAVSVVKTGSVISLWVQEPSFSQGAVSFEGIVLNPGFTGAAGKIITVNFKAKQAGGAALVFSSGAILANDGQGTNILTGMGGGNYEIFLKTITPPTEEKPAQPKPAPTLPSAAEKKAEEKQKSAEIIGKPEITSPTHPDQAAWYNNNNVKFKWELPYGVTGVSVLLNDKPDSNPGPISDGLFSIKEYQDIKDGVWYLHLKFKDKSGWSEIDHFKAQIDTTPPLPFKIDVIQKASGTLPILYFKTEDAVSGIGGYEVKIAQQDFLVKPEEALLAVPELPAGEHTAIIKAIDKAGNETVSYADFTVEPTEVPAVEAPAAESYPREPKISKAVAPVFIKIGSWELDYFTVFVILLVFTVFAISFLAFWAGLMRSKLKKETDEAERILHKSLIEFKKSFEENLDSLIELEKETGRAEEKQAARESLKRKIDFMENKVLKEIKDIEDLLK